MPIAAGDTLEKSNICLDCFQFFLQTFHFPLFVYFLRFSHFVGISYSFFLSTLCSLFMSASFRPLKFTLFQPTRKVYQSTVRTEPSVTKCFMLIVWWCEELYHSIGNWVFPCFGYFSIKTFQSKCETGWKLQWSHSNSVFIRGFWPVYAQQQAAINVSPTIFDWNSYAWRIWEYFKRGVLVKNALNHLTSQKPHAIGARKLFR